MYATPLLQAATYVPPSILSKYVGNHHALPVSKPDLGEHYLDYTWLISGVLYEGGTDLLIPELMKKGSTKSIFIMWRGPHRENLLQGSLILSMLSSFISSFSGPS